MMKNSKQKEQRLLTGKNFFGVFSPKTSIRFIKPLPIDYYIA
jgi:hypothetical protein